MGETGFVHFAGNLDPRAQEFWPGNNNDLAQHVPYFVQPPPQPPPPSHQVYFPYHPQAVPFHDATFIPYPPQHTQYPPLPAYVSVVAAPPPQSAVPTRTLTLTSVPSGARDLIRREMEVFGEVRGVQMERIGEGIVSVYFYDLRHAERALKEIRQQHMKHQATVRSLFNSTSFQHPHEESLAATLPTRQPGRGMIAGYAVWAQFSVPTCNALRDGQNQGTIVVFNLDPNVSTSSLGDIFQAYGAIKEVRETPLKKQQRFVEFYDVRDAAKALREMDGKEIYGKRVLIEFSRPGGYSRRFFYAGGGGAAHKNSSTNCNYIGNPRIASYVHPPPSQPLPPFQRNLSSSSLSHNVTARGLLKHDHRSVGKDHGSFSENPSESSSQCNNEGNVVVGRVFNVGDGSMKRIVSKKSMNIKSGTVSGKQHHRSCKALKGRLGKNKMNDRFRIREEPTEEASYFSDSRTTVMIKNIPNKYSQKLLLNMLDNHCIHCNEQVVKDGDDQPLSSYDFLYLPIDFNNKCNVGYGFVNMTSPQAARRLYKAFNHQHWEVFNSRKICEVTYARVQGLEALKEHFKNSKFPSETENFLPVVFSPPRDGNQQTEPLPIVSPNQLQYHINSCHIDIKSIARETDGECRKSDEDGDNDQEEGREGSLIDSSFGSSNSQNGGDSGYDEKDSSKGSSSSLVV